MNSKLRIPLCWKVGRDLLTEVVKQGGRTKVGKMAKNKLGISASD